MSKKRSATQQRKERISVVSQLRRQLASKTRENYTTEFRYRIWLNQTHDLIEELQQELSILDDPGEYDELPIAVIADELGFNFTQTRLLVRSGEIEASGKRAHERVSRKEMERLARLGRSEILRLSQENAEATFNDAISHLRNGDIKFAEKAYRRLKAKQSVIGNHALALEIVILFIRGRYEEADKAIKFILVEKLNDRSVISAYIAECLRGVCFKSPHERARILRLIKQFEYEVIEAVHTSKASEHLQLTAMFIATAVCDYLENYIADLLPSNRREIFYQYIRNSIFTTLYGYSNAQVSLKSKAFVVAITHKIPAYWEPAQLLENLQE